MTAETIMTGTPARIHGRRRPQRVRVLSERRPISGSVTTSLNRASIRMKPTVARSTPSVSE